MKSERKKHIDKCLELIRKPKIKLFGKKCQICGKSTEVGNFHILNVGSHPRLQLYWDNIILAGWFCCHHPFHHDYYKARDVIVPRLKQLLGEDYEQQLRQKEKELPKLSLDRIKEIYQELKDSEK